MNGQHLSELMDKKSIEEVWALHCRYMRSFGFDRLLYGFTRFKTENSFGDRQDALILSNHDPAYLEIYFADDRFRDAPMTRWAEHNAGACSWSVRERLAQNGELTENAKRVLQLNEEFGVNCGITISFKDLAPGGFGAIGLTGATELSQDDVDRIWARHGDEILLCNNAMHLRALTLPSPNRNRLTDRQREVLEWTANGKTVSEVGALIDRKPATVEKHLRLARAALNAETTAQAVLKASVQNQIFMDTLR
ncbi:MAG: LuxR family transcriptional regulator [Pseudomonadota bacterium]